MINKQELLKYGLIASLFTNFTIGGRFYVDTKEHKESIHELSVLNQNLEIDNAKLHNVITDNLAFIDQLANRKDELTKENDKLKKENDNLKKEEMKRKEADKRKLNMTATAYISKCRGCSGFTYTGFNVRNTIKYKGMRIIAANFNKLPLYSIVEIKTDTEVFKAIVLDTGGAIRNSNTIDLLVSTYDEAIQFGREQVTVTMIRKGNS